jgi:hypothetical protein
VNELLRLASARPLTTEERSQLQRLLEAGELEAVDPLLLAAALGTGAQHLRPEEADALFTRAIGGLKRPRSRFRRSAPFALAAFIVTGVLVALLSPAGDETRLKAGPGSFDLAFAAQIPGSSQARALKPPLRLFEHESLRIVLTSTEPFFVAIYEEDAHGTHRLWTSSGPLPAGRQALGPEAGGAGLLPDRGRTSQFIVVACESEVGLPQTLGPLAPGCSRQQLSVEAR